MIKRLFLAALLLIGWYRTLGAGNQFGVGVPAQPQIPTQGIIDPTVATYNGSKPIRCTASTTPDGTFTEQNRATLQFAFAEATSTGKNVLIPPCQTDALNSDAPCPADESCAYAISRKGGTGTTDQKNCGVDLDGDHDFAVFGHGAILRMAGSIATSDYNMVCVRNASHVRFIGLTFSGRDLVQSGPPNRNEQTHIVRVGDSSSTGVDDVAFVDCTFEDGYDSVSNKGDEGDCLSLIGGSLFTRRTTVYNSSFRRCRRAGIENSRNMQFSNYVENTFSESRKGGALHNEPTGTGPCEYQSFIGNHIKAAPNEASTVILTGVSGTFPATGFVVADNIIDHSVIGDTLHVTQLVLSHNTINHDDTDTGAATPSINIFRRYWDSWIDDNHFVHKTGASSDGVLRLASQGGSCSEGVDAEICRVHDVWVSRNRIEIWDSDSSLANKGVYLRLADRAWVVGNNISYHDVHTASGNVGAQMVRIENSTDTANQASRTWVTGNVARRGLQRDGVTQAGRFLALVFVNIPSPSTKWGATWVRGNLIDGGLNGIHGTKSSGITVTYPDGPPVISDNQVRDTTNTLNGIVPGAYVTDQIASPRESLSAASATLSPSRLTTVITGRCVGGDAYTLPDGTRDGQTRDVLVVSACTSGGTLTPTHFGDGTSVSWLTSTSFPFSHARFVWDATSTKWRLLDNDQVTVNP